MSDPCTYVPGCTGTPEWCVTTFNKTPNPPSDDQMVTEYEFRLCLECLHDWVHGLALCATDSAVVFAREARMPDADCGPVPYIPQQPPAAVSDLHLPTRPVLSVIPGGGR